MSLSRRAQKVFGGRLQDFMRSVVGLQGFTV